MLSIWVSIRNMYSFDAKASVVDVFTGLWVDYLQGKENSTNRQVCGDPNGFGLEVQRVSLCLSEIVIS